MQKLTPQQLAQAKAASNPAGHPQFQVIRNGGLNDAVNFAVEDFYKAALVLKRATRNYSAAWADQPRGMQSFIGQQFFRMNAAGMTLDALGYQGVTEVMAELHKDAVAYINATMAVWNKLIDDEGDVQRMYEEIAAEEKAQGNPPAAMQ